MEHIIGNRSFIEIAKDSLMVLRWCLERDEEFIIHGEGSEYPELLVRMVS
ncbi:hypothetical protein [Halalkalicoccus salilacus]